MTIFLTILEYAFLAAATTLFVLAGIKTVKELRKDKKERWWYPARRYLVKCLIWAACATFLFFLMRHFLLHPEKLMGKNLIALMNTLFKLELGAAALFAVTGLVAKFKYKEDEVAYRMNMITILALMLCMVTFLYAKTLPRLLDIPEEKSKPATEQVEKSNYTPDHKRSIYSRTYSPIKGSVSTWT